MISKMADKKTSWTELNFIERQMLPIMSPDYNERKPVKWIEFECQDLEKKWISKANKITMDFGGIFHSIFLRWAVTVNGLHVATEKYQSQNWIDSGKSFSVVGIRNKIDGSGPHQTYVRIWDGKFASEIHASSIPMLAAWAFCNMYSCLEEFIFKIFRVFLESNPLTICKGDEFKDLRKIYRDRELSDVHLLKWNELWDNRLDSWHRKKLYDGIERVFNNFIQQSGLVIPSGYTNKYDYSDIAKTLGGIAMIRNCFIHGETEVPQELGDFCETFQSSFFKYKTGDKFGITLNELAIFEYFTDTFTQTLNTSFLELAHPELKNL